MLPALQHAVPVSVPSVAVVRRPGERQALPDGGPERGEPFGVARYLPVPVHLDDAAELAVGAGPERRPSAAERELQAKAHAAVFAQVVAVVGLAHAAFQPREQERQRVGVVPHVGTAPLAAYFVGVAALEAVEGAVLQAQHGRALEYRQVGGDRIDYGRGQRRREQSFLERRRFPVQPVPVRKGVARRVARVLPQRGVVVPPTVGRRLAAARIAARIVRSRVPVVGVNGEVPGQHESRPALRARLHPQMSRQQAVGAAQACPAGANLLVAPVREPAGRRKVAPIGAHVVDPDALVGGPAPVLLATHIARVGGHGHVSRRAAIRPLAARSHADHGQPVVPPKAVDLGGSRHRVVDRQADGIGQGRVLRVVDLDLEERRRDAGVVFTERYEGVERGDGHGTGKRVVAQRERGDRKLAAEARRAEVWRRRQVAARRTRSERRAPGACFQASGVGWLKIPLQHARIEHLAVPLRLDGKVGVTVGAALVRPVEYLPVDQPPVAGQADAAAADAAERKRNLAGPRPLMDKLRHCR